MIRVAALVTAAALILAPAQVSGAAPRGGPTSVLLTTPDFDRTASLYHTDKPYERLLWHVSSNEASGEVGGDGWSSSSSSFSPHARGHFVRVVWLAHDMWVWRVDRIYWQAPGGPWIGTTLHESGALRETDKTTWHTTSNPRDLLLLLAQLKLLSPAKQTSADSAAIPVPTPVPSEPAPAPVAKAQADPSALTGWRWSLVGALAGALLTMAAHRLTRRRDPTPRWELIDAE